ncbi:MAG: DHH family phosphoesterase [Bacteroidales bacterium]
MITKIIREELVQKVKKAIEKYERFVIVSHVSPDGDALGSSLGLFHFLGEKGKEVTVVYADQVSDNLSWLPGVKDALFYDETPEAANEVIAAAEVIFCVDFNAAKRMGEMAKEVVASNALRIMVDHHLYPEDFCQIIISHPEISSTSELVFRLICRMGYFDRIDLNIATAVYTGMMTDTGAFTYNSNYSEIYVIISELMKIGINKDKIYDRVFNTFSESRERLMGYTINKKMKIYNSYKASMISLTAQELEDFNYKKGDTEGFVNIPLSVKGIVFSVFFRQDKEYIKVSLRSKGDFPANKVAEQFFNGGGHKNASGGEFYGTMEEAQRVLESALPQFENYLKD